MNWLILSSRCAAAAIRTQTEKTILSAKQLRSPESGGTEKAIIENIAKFHRDERAVAFLIFYILAAIFTFGISYAVLSDVRDAVAVPIWNALSGYGNEYNDADSLWGFDFVNFLLSFSVMFFVIGLMWYSKQMAQKPEQPWG